MSVGRRKLAPLWALALALACTRHTGHAQDGSSESSYKHHPALSPIARGPGGVPLRGATVFPSLRTIPVVRASNPAHNGRVCSTWGSFHYKTFDGDVFRFPGLCNYVFSEHCGAAYEDFNIQLRRSQESAAPTLSRVLMKVDGMVIQLTKGSVLVNGHPVLLPFSQSGVLIQQSSSYTKVEARLGLVLMWNHDDSLLLELDTKYANKTCGLCGDFNGMPVVSELLSHNTKLTPMEFGNLQKMDDPTEQCQDPVPEPPRNCSTGFGICEELLHGQLFSGCVALVDVGSYLEACRQDLCFCEDTDLLSCVCHTLAEYSRQCTHAGGLPQDWRGPDFCPQKCPNNMQYHECRSPCADTCSNQEHSRACEDHCVAGCFCPEGTVLDDVGQTGCVPVSKCACVYNGAAYAPGATYSTDCTNCTCSGGRWSCQEFPCPGTCSVLGGAHFSTFDGKQYTVHGDCSYVLTKPCDSSAFTVLAELRRCGLTDSETCLKSVTLNLDGAQTVVVIKASGEVFLNQIYTQLPISAANVTIFRPSTFFIIAQTSLGLQLNLQLVPTMQLFMRLAPKLRGQTCGLCGNFNSIQADDFRTLSGVVEATAAAFFNTFKTQAACPNIRNSFEDPCSLSVENEKYAQHWCSQLTDADGPFGRCHAAVKPGTYYSNCMFDTCNCERSEDCLCAALSSYVHACAAKGVQLSGWRDGVCTKPMTTCPKSMTYHYHVSTCQPTCRSLSEGDITCSVGFIPVDGCICPKGTFLDDTGKCVQASNCPCYHRGSMIPNGESVHDSGAICTCTHGKLSCIGGQAPAPVCAAPMVFFDCRNATPGDTGAGCQKSCHTLDMTCYSPQCVPGCVCPDGLVADGEGGCITAEDCPCVHNEASYRAGQTIRVGCNTCTCDSRMWQCTDDPCLATCAVYGDGHYLTFDGQSYSFNGDCEYTLVQNHCGGKDSTQDSFRVVTENVPCGTTGTTCSKAIKIFLGGFELKLSHGKVEVIGTDESQEVPYTIRQMGIYLVVDTDIGLVLLWDKKTSIFINLSPEFKGRVCGLCGNFDDIAVNDFATRSWSVVGDVLEFGNSWKLSPSCPDALVPKDPCTANPFRKSWAQKQCSILHGPTFAACHAHVEPARYYEACVNDACACDSGGDCECFCTAVAAYAQACHEVGLCVSWRTPSICPLFCDYYNPEGQCEWHYQPCGAPCLRTCRNPRGDCLRDVRGLEGCYPKCPPEAPIFDEDKMQCVATCPTPPLPPRCHVHGKSYRPGAVVPSDKNCQSCLCTERGVECTYKAEACVCTYNGQRFHPGDVIYHTTDGTGGCISARCGANGTIERRVYPCSPTTPVPPTTFSFSTPPLVVSSTHTPSNGPSSAHTGPPSSAWPTTAGTSPRTRLPTASASLPPVCGEKCLWSPWMDVSRPGRGADSGDFDTLENLRAHGYRVCESPRSVECRAEDAPGVPLRALGQRVQCSPDVGLTCRNREQASGLCYNYQIRVQCCTPLACSTSSSPAQTTPPTTSKTTETQASGSSAPSSTPGTVALSTARTTPAPGTATSVKKTFSTPSPPPVPATSTSSMSTTAPGTSVVSSKPTPTEPSTSSCLQELCTWTEWIDGSYPAPGINGGDFDTFQNLRDEGYTFCESPRSVQCRAESFPNTPLADLGQDVICSRTEGLICLNKNQLPPICYNYEIRIQCCETVNVCRDITRPPKTVATTWPTPHPTRAQTQTTFTTHMPSASTEQPTATSRGGPTATSITQGTHTRPVTRNCHPRCNWTKWFDVDFPSPGSHGGDKETYNNIIRSGEKICRRPEEITRLQCRAKSHPEVSIEHLGQVVQCNREEGLVCRNQDQQGPFKMCLNYEVRVLCCETPRGCHVTSTPGSTSSSPAQTTPSTTSKTTETRASGSSAPSSTPGTVALSTARTTPAPGTATSVKKTFSTPSPPPVPATSTSSMSTTAPGTSVVSSKPTPTEPSTSSCLQELCTWTEWIDGSYPAPGINGGDFDTFQNLRDEGYTFCESPRSVQCRAESFPNTPLADLGQDVICSRTEGLICLNKNQLPPICYNYEIRIQCCETVNVCRDITRPPKTVATTWPTPHPTRAQTQTTFTTHMPSASTEQPTATSRGGPTATSITQGTHTRPVTRNCHPRCNWTKWFDVDFPSPGPHGGDKETYNNIIRSGEKICRRPEEITRLQCRAKSHPEVSIEHLGQVVQCNREEGLVCRNQDQQGPFKMCLNYEVRVLCCETPRGCPVTSTPVTAPSTPSGRATSPTQSTSSWQKSRTTTLVTTSTTSTPQTNTTYAHTSSTTSAPTARTTSAPTTSTTSVPTTSTISGPETTLSPVPTISTTSASASSTFGPGTTPSPAPTTSTTSAATTSTISAPTTSTTSGPGTTPSPVPTTSTTSAPTTRTTSASTASTNSGPETTPGPVPTTSTTSASTTSTTSGPGTTPSPVPTTSTISVPTTSTTSASTTSTTSGPGTTPSPVPTTSTISVPTTSTTSASTTSTTSGPGTTPSPVPTTSTTSASTTSTTSAPTTSTISAPTTSTTSATTTSTTSAPTPRRTSAPTTSTISASTSSTTSATTTSTTSATTTSTISAPTTSTTLSPTTSTTSTTITSTTSAPISSTTSTPQTSTTSSPTTSTTSGPGTTSSPVPTTTTTSAPTTSTTSAPTTRTTSVPTRSTISTATTSTTSGPGTTPSPVPTTSTTSAPTTRTTSASTASTTSGPGTTPSPVPTTSTNSAPTTRTTSAPTTSTTSAPTTSTTSAPTSSTTSATTTSTISVPTTSTTSVPGTTPSPVPTTSTTSAPTTSTTSAPKTSTISAPTTSTTSAPTTSTTSTPTSSTTSTPQTSTTSASTTSITSGPGTTPSPVPTTSTTSAPTTSTTSAATTSRISAPTTSTTSALTTSTTSASTASKTSGLGTTPSPVPTTSTTSPPTTSTTSASTASKTSGPGTTPSPVPTTSTIFAPRTSTTSASTTSTTPGPGTTPSPVPTTSTASVSKTSTSHISISKTTHSQPVTRDCHPRCTWTKWFDVDFPSPGPHGGDKETYNNIIRKIQDNHFGDNQHNVHSTDQHNLCSYNQHNFCSHNQHNLHSTDQHILCPYKQHNLCSHNQHNFCPYNQHNLHSTDQHILCPYKQHNFGSYKQHNLCSYNQHNLCLYNQHNLFPYNQHNLCYYNQHNLCPYKQHNLHSTDQQNLSCYKQHNLRFWNYSQPCYHHQHNLCSYNQHNLCRYNQHNLGPNNQHNVCSYNQHNLCLYSQQNLCTASVSKTSTSHVSISKTTHSQPVTRDCHPRCTWTKWFDVDFPSPGPHGGDKETYNNIIRSGEKICRRPEEITRLQCRAESHPEVSIEHLGQVVQCSREEGLVCRNQDQQGPFKMCLNYEVRVLCCETPKGCPVTSTPVTAPSTPSGRATSPTQSTSSWQKSRTTTLVTTSTTSTPQTSTTSAPTTSTTSAPTTSTTSTPQTSTSSAPTSSTTSAPTSSTISAPTTSIISAPTTSTTSSPTTSTTSATTTSTTSAPTSSTTSTPQTSKTSAATSSTTSGSGTTPSPVTTTSTASVSKTSTSHVSVSKTTHSQPVTRDCHPRCTWTKWFDVDFPSPGPHGGDKETYNNIIRSGEKICRRPEEITRLQCRAESHPEVSIEHLGQVVQCSREEGLVCRNQDQQGPFKMCLNYEVRVLCCETPRGCPVTSTPVTAPSTPSGRATSPTQSTYSWQKSRTTTLVTSSTTSSTQTSTTSAPTTSTTPASTPSTTSAPTTSTTSAATTSTTSAPTTSTTSTPQTTTSSAPTSSTTSAPTTSTTSAPTSSTTSAPTTSTISAPTTSTISAPTTSTTSAPTASMSAPTSTSSAPTSNTTSAPTTSTTSAPITSKISAPTTSTTSTPQTSTISAPTTSTTSTPQTSTTSSPTTSTTSAPITSTTSAPTTSTTSTPQTSISSAPTSSTTSAPTASTTSFHITSTTSPPTSSTSSTPQTSKTSAATSSTTSGSGTTPSPVPTTSTASVSKTSTSRVSVSKTTHSQPVTRDCHPRCTWTKWFDVDFPSPGPHGGDKETYNNIIRSGEKICRRPEEITRLQCRAESHPEVSIEHLGQVVQCSREEGLVCRNQDQQGPFKMCLNYEVRVLCCETPRGCPVTSTPVTAPSTPSGRATSPTQSTSSWQKSRTTTLVTTSTTSNPQTSTTSAPTTSTIPASIPSTTSAPTTSTTSAPTTSTTSAPTHRTTSGPTTSTTLAPTTSTTSAPTTSTNSAPTTSTISASTTSTISAPTTSTISAPTSSTTSTPQTSKTSAATSSTTSGSGTTPSPVPTTSTTSASTTSTTSAPTTSTTSGPGTAPSPVPSTSTTSAATTSTTSAPTTRTTSAPTSSMTSGPGTTPSPVPTTSTTSAPTTSTTSGPGTTPSPVPTTSTTSAPITSTTSGPRTTPSPVPTTSTTSAPTTSTTSASTASTTSGPGTTPSPVPTTSTTSAPTTRTTSASTASTTSGPGTTPSPVPTTSTTSAPTTSMTSGPGTTPSPVPTTSTTSASTTSTISPLTTSTTSAPTTSTTSASTASTTSGPGTTPSPVPTTSTTSAPTTRTTSASTASTTSGPGTTPSPVPTTSTTSAPTTSMTSGPGTTPSPVPTTSTTSASTTSTISPLTTSTTSAPTTSMTSGPGTTPSPVPTTSTTSAPTTSTTSGPGTTPSPVPTTSTTHVSKTSTSHLSVSKTTHSQPVTSDCHPLCAWTKWFDVDFPSPGPHGGDKETYNNIIRSGEKICRRPEEITRLQCRAESHPEVSIEHLGQVVQCSREEGLVCRNQDQQGPFKMCLNYEVRVLCCETPRGCPVTSVTPYGTSPTNALYPSLSTSVASASVASTSVASSSVASSSVAYSTQTCFCNVADRLYPAGSTIYHHRDLAGHCYYARCSQDCQVVRRVDSDCPSTTLPPAPATSPSTSTSEPVTELGCPNAVPPRKKGETWATPNCSEATCEGNNVISLRPRTCPRVEKPTCANGYPAVKVADQDGCCHHYQCQCVCSGWGDPHYITFDGTYYTFLDNCTYVLVQQIVPVYGHFRVLVDNYFCGAEDGLSCPRSIILEYHQDRVVLTRKPVHGVMTNEIIFNNKVVGPGFRKNGIVVSRIGIKMYATIPELGVQVMFSGLIFSVEVPFSKFANNTEGQCGTCTNDRKDECRTPRGTVVASCSEMSGLWNVSIPDQPACHRPHPTPTTVRPTTVGSTTVGPTTPPAPCLPSPICQLILSKVFEPCHTVIPPLPFYEGCVFDRCHMTDLDVVCSSLELYAALCASHDICIDWRGRTGHMCPFTCPADKVYQPCGPSNPSYCYGNDSASLGALLEAGPITEGCFCPEGMTLFSTSVQVCVPTGCPRCLGPHGEPVKVGHTVSMDCQECTCEAATWTLTCRPKLCPLPPACPLPGFVPVPATPQAGQCCPQYSCACNTSRCPAPVGCPEGARAIPTYEEGACCPVQNCSWTVCSINGTLYQPGAVVSSSLCETCRCELPGGPPSDAFVVSCETQICNTHCPVGFEYQEQSGQCCGTCVQVACVTNTSKSPAHLFYPGETWSDPGNHCVTHECEKHRDGLVVVTTKKACPPLSCSLDEARMSKDGCCRFCPPPPPPYQNQSTCAVYHRSQIIQQQGCSSSEPVRLAYCRGNCGDSSSMYSLEGNMVEHRCQCCQELRTSLRNVTLHCTDGSSRAFSYTQVEECGCMGRRCPAPGDTQHSEEAEPEPSPEAESGSWERGVPVSPIH
ncbi:MUC5AC isoform 1 [Pan troglodytes]|uniref:MUC5AC isoform 1 n=1 Tax=Pan troglodytes TaxID=9598 RepID=A0A2J8JVE7_PANTR|nr:MUC5AC isoform 1 [Pan troglodytes]